MHVGREKRGQPCGSCHSWVPGHSSEGTLLGPTLPAKTFLTELSVFIKRIILFHSLLVNRNPVAGMYF